MSEKLEEATGNTALMPSLGRLSAIIFVFGINKAIWRDVDEYFAAEGQGKLISLSRIVGDWGLKQRWWEVLELRSGFANKHTYDEISGSIGGIGRERVRQILVKSLRRLEDRLYRDIPLLTLLEAQTYELWSSDVSSINSAVFVQQEALAEIGWEPLQGSDVRRLLLALRSLVSAGMHTVPARLPQLNYFACSLPPEIVGHPLIAARVAAEVAEDAVRNPRWTYELLVKTVLEEAGEPLHYKEIADRADQMGVRPDVNLKGVHNILLIKTDKFALVGQGTYGLTAWGLTSVDNYVNIIAEALKASNRVMTVSEVSFCVNNKRPIKRQSLQMTLDLHPRFYRTVAGTYGLRARLPAREKQTLRTPVWLIEDSASFERVAKAIERGYDVETLVAMDRL